MDWQRLLEVGIVAICVIWCITFSPAFDSIPASKTLAWFAVFSIGAISALDSASVIAALLEWSWLLILVFVVAVMRHWGYTDRKALDTLLLHFVLVSSVGYVYWFWSTNAAVYFEPLPEGLTRKVNFPGFANVRFFSDYQSFLLLLLPTALTALTRPGIIRQLGRLISASFFAIALIAGSRSLLVAHLLLHFSLFVVFRKSYLPYLKEQIALWTYGAVLFILVTKVLPFFLNSGTSGLVFSDIDRTTSSGRLFLWQLCLELIREHPLLGIGPLQFATIANPIASSPHNFFLQIATEWGLPAMLLTTWLLFAHIKSRLTDLASNGLAPSEPVSLAMTGATIAVLLQALVSSSPLNYPVGQAIAVLCFAYPWMNRTVANAKPHQPVRLHVYGLIGLGVLFCTITTLQSIQHRNNCFYYNHWPTEPYAPRFWQQGWLIGPCGQGESILSSVIQSPQKREK